MEEVASFLRDWIVKVLENREVIRKEIVSIKKRIWIKGQLQG